MGAISSPVIVTPECAGGNQSVAELRRLRAVLLAVDRDADLEDALVRVENALIAAIGRGRAER